MAMMMIMMQQVSKSTRVGLVGADACVIIIIIISVSHL
jgi:hypothetical protein